MRGTFFFLARGPAFVRGNDKISIIKTRRRTRYRIASGRFPLRQLFNSTRPIQDASLFERNKNKNSDRQMLVACKIFIEKYF